MKFKRRFRRKFKYNKKRSFMFIFFFLVCLSFGLGYSLIQTDINIFGTTVLKDNRWDVHFENIQEGEDSVSPTSEPEITDNTTVTFSAKLKNPGDKYEFLIDVVNAGTIDAKIASITLSPELTLEQQNYFFYDVKYENDLDLVENQALDVGSRETLKVSFKYLEQEDNSLYPGDDQTFNVTLTIDYVQGLGEKVISPFLYDVLRNEANNGGLAKEYIGDHQDSIDISKSNKKIYHWYASTNADGTQVLNMNNVIFANHCWQMIRTTDTGGVKMIYNGEVEDDKCLNTRGKHVGYSTRASHYMASNFWYGTDFEYDSSSKLFSLTGIVEQVVWNETTASDLIGKYTCKLTAEDGLCSTLYYVESYNNSTSAFLNAMTTESNYYQYGTAIYNYNSDSPAYSGYMYNTAYRRLAKNMNKAETIFQSSTLSNNYWYGDSFTWNNNSYSLNNPIKIETTDQFQNLVGKYTFFNSSSDYSNTVIKYITAVNGTTAYYIDLKSGNDINYYDDTYTYGDSYVDNGDGTYTLNNPTTISRINYYNEYRNFGNKYVCKNSTNNKCNNPWYVFSATNKAINYYSVSDNYKYANNFTYTNGKYILDTGIESFYDFSNEDNRNKLKNAHYTCWNKSGECTTLAYIFYIEDNTKLSYINLNNGINISEAINKMLYAEDVNSKSSVIKNDLEGWYNKYMLDYTDFLEDVVFCYSREQLNVNESGWYPNGGDISTYMRFNGFSSLKCNIETDMFSVQNAKAKIKYPVGLITRREFNNLGNNTIKKTGEKYYLGDITSYNVANTYGTDVLYDGSVSYLAVTSSAGLRPAISLKPKTKYISGDGSMENPYVIDTE